MVVAIYFILIHLSLLRVGVFEYLLELTLVGFLTGLLLLTGLQARTVQLLGVLLL